MILIDANNIAHKAFYQYSGHNYNLPIKIFFSLLFYIVKNDYYGKSNYVIWDSKFGYWRKKIYNSYKQNRIIDSDKQKFFEFRTMLKDKLGKTSYKQIMLKDFEADDVIANIIREKTTMKSNEPIMIVSDDKDLYQLLRVRPVVFIKKIGKQTKRYYGIRDFEEEFGIKPELWSSIKAIAGDSSDNISGVPGIGIKRALDVIKKYGHVLDWIDNVTPYDGKVSEHAWSARLKNKKVKMFYKLVDLIENHSGIEINLKNNLYK